MEFRGKAYYELAEIKRFVRDPSTRLVTQAARQGAVSLGYASDDDMAQVIARLQEDEIYKTMESTKFPGLWQDVYLTNDSSQEIYIKIQKSSDGKKGVIVSFKKK